MVTDRFSGSTLAYQGYGRGLDVDELAGLSAWATGGLEPDLVVLLDVAGAWPPPAGCRPPRPDGGGRRRRSTGGWPTATGPWPPPIPARWVVVDGSGTVDEVAEPGVVGVRRRWRTAGEPSRELAPVERRVRPGGRPGAGGGPPAGRGPAPRCTPTCWSARRAPASGTAALAFAAALLCPEGGVRRVRRRASGSLAGVHPDVVVVEREGAFHQRRPGPGDPPAGHADARTRAGRKVLRAHRLPPGPGRGAGAAQDDRGAAAEHGVRDPRRPRAARAGHHRLPLRPHRLRAAAGRAAGRRRWWPRASTRRWPPTWPRPPAAASTGPACWRPTPASPPAGRRGGRCRPASTAPARRWRCWPPSWSSCWRRPAVAPLEARHAAELAELEERVKRSGERGAGPQGPGRPPPAGAAPAAHRRAALRPGHPGRRSTATPWCDGGSTPPPASTGLDALQKAAEALIRNPTETLLLQALLLRLPPLRARLAQGASAAP